MSGSPEHSRRPDLSVLVDEYMEFVSDAVTDPEFLQLLKRPRQDNGSSGTPPVPPPSDLTPPESQPSS